MSGGHYLFWHPEQEGEIQLIQAMNYGMAIGMVTLIKDEELQNFAFQSNRPDELDIVAAISGDASRAEKTVEAYNELIKENMKPLERAKKAFSKIFKRAAQTRANWWEAKALSTIVSRWTHKYGEEKDNDDTTLDNREPLAGSMVSLSGRAHITKDVRRKHR